MCFELAQNLNWHERVANINETVGNEIENTVILRDNDNRGKVAGDVIELDESPNNIMNANVATENANFETIIENESDTVNQRGNSHSLEGSIEGYFNPVEEFSFFYFFFCRRFLFEGYDLCVRWEEEEKEEEEKVCRY